MLTPAYKKQFTKDLKLAVKRGKKIEKIKTVISNLIARKPLALRYRDHQLPGNYTDLFR